MISNSTQIADYFLVVGLPDQREYYRDLQVPESPSRQQPAGSLDPITDVAVIFKGIGDPVPHGFECIEKTPAGHSANLNSGSFRAQEVYLCYRRGRDKPPLTDMGVMAEGARLLDNAAAVFQTPTGRIANINNQSSPQLFVTYSRSPPDATLDTLVVMEVCVVNATKGEEAPHTFCKIEQKLNTATFSMGSDIYICYRKARLRDHVISFEPAVLSRYPLEDTTAPYPLDPNIPMFCLPLGASVEAWPASARDPQPVFSSFVLTQTREAQDKYYGCVITFYEPLSIEKLSLTQINRLGLIPDMPLKDQGKRIAASKAICLLSQYGFFSEFKQYLTLLYKMSFSSKHRLPIERVISHLLHEVPVPSAERPRILAQLSPEESILFTRPEDLPLPPSCASFTSLLNDLGVDKTLDVFLYAILEQPMLVHSVRPNMLTMACEAIKTMVFPFIWSFPYIPFCPLALSHNAEIPMGFIIGIDTSYFDYLDEIPRGVICIDLDTGNILLPEEKKHITGKLLPKKPAAQLHARLEKVHKALQRSSHIFSEFVDLSNDIAPEKLEMRKQRETSLELECRDAFLFFMATILRGYRQYLVVPTNVKLKHYLDAKTLFRIEDFVRSRDKSLAKFFETIDLENKQNFAKFIEELTFSTKPQVFDFFTECCRRVEDMVNSPNSRSVRLIETSRDVDNERTVVIPPPSSQGLEDGRLYSYDHFPAFDESLFSVPAQRDASKPPLVNGNGAAGLRVDDQSDKSENSLVSNRSSRQTFDWNIIKRTRQEVKSSQQMLQRASNSYDWAKIIEAHCYAVWFCMLPGFCKLVHSRRKLLSYAVSRACNWARFSSALGSDQAPYRIIFAMADLYRHPAVAVQLLMRIRKLNFEPNSATLVIINRVLYTSWQSGSYSRPARLWRLVRDVWSGVCQFRKAGIRYRSQSHQSLVSQSQTSSEQHFTLQPILLTQNSFTADVNGRDAQIDPTTLIYSPRGPPPGFGKFSDASPLQPSLSLQTSTLRRMPSDQAEQPTDSQSLPVASSAAYSSPYIRQAGKVFDVIQKVAEKVATGPVGQAGWRIVESTGSTPFVRSASGLERGSQDSMTQQPGQIHASGSASNVALPPSINVMSPGSDGTDFEGPRSARPTETASGFLKRLVSPHHRQQSAMKESRSTPQFSLSSAQRQLTLGLAQMKSKLGSAVQQIAAATSAAPDDSLIDLHTEASMQPPGQTPSLRNAPLSYREQSMSSLSIKSQEEGPSAFSTALRGNGPPADVASIGSQVTSDTNDSYNRTNQNLAHFHQNSISSSNSKSRAHAVLSHSHGALDEPSLQVEMVNATASLQGSNGGGNGYLGEDDLDFWPLSPPKDECQVEIVLCAANRCTEARCGQILFEEDIMAMWSASDSIFNAVCPMCGFRFIPKLEIYIKDYRRLESASMASLGDEEPQECQDANSFSGFVGCKRRLRRCNSDILAKWSASELKRCEVGDFDPLTNVEIAKERQCQRLIGPMSCIFLSPLALRKEIEQATERSVSTSTLFSDGLFVDNHDTLYWNLLFVNARMMFHSHLPSLVMFSRLMQPASRHGKKPSLNELREAASIVSVQVVWDNLMLYNVSSRPVYWHWAVNFGQEYPIANSLVDFRPFSRRLMTKLLTSIRRADMLSAIKLILLVRRRGLTNERFFREQSMYRILLGLSVVALGRYNIDIKAFDKSYYQTYDQIKQASAANMAAMRAQGKMPLSMEMRSWDQPPSEAAIYCRRAHMHADIYHDFDQRPAFLAHVKLVNGSVQPETLSQADQISIATSNSTAN